jgi:peptidoglycan/xylan/chitin deacetylase (PgdA/CDA1 family)
MDYKRLRHRAGIGRYIPKRLYPVLLYHHIGSNGRRSRSYMEPVLFEEHLRHLRDGGYHVIYFADLVESIRSGRKLPRKTVSITFDDGWKDNYDLGVPLIARYRFPVTVYLVSGRIGLKGYLSWKEIREMEDAGFRFGAHGVNHPRLTEITLSAARREIVDCKKALEDGLGKEVKSFCYPYGFVNRAVRNLVEETGYRGACCNAPGRLWPDGDLFAMKRVTMTYRMANPALLLASLSGYYVFYKELWAGNKEYIMNDG